MKKFLEKSLTLGVVVSLGFFSVLPNVSAQGIISEKNKVSSEMSDREVESAFRKVVNINNIDNIKAPTVVELSLPINNSANDLVLIKDLKTGQYLGNYLREPNFVVGQIPIKVASFASSPQPFVTMKEIGILVDNNFNKSIDFNVNPKGSGFVQINYETESPIVTSQLNLSLDRFVSLPRKIKIEAKDETGAIKTVFSADKLDSNRVYFPKTTSRYFAVTLEYSQFLRINEMNFMQENSTVVPGERTVRFLAVPGNSYKVFYDADWYPEFDETEKGNFTNDKGVVKLDSNSRDIAFSDNEFFKESDVDKDDISDFLDNCVNVYNPEQVDVDQNGRGDACDDWDRDGIINSLDNCPEVPNREQKDTDRDKIGDACDDEESRFMEKNPWLVWVGLGSAVVAISALFVLVAKTPEFKREDEENEKEKQDK